MPTYTYQCRECESFTEDFFKFSDRPDTITCACGAVADHTITAVGLMTKEAYLDGTKRKGFQDLKEASKLNRLSNIQKDGESKRQIASEIRRMGVQLKKD